MLVLIGHLQVSGAAISGPEAAVICRAVVRERKISRSLALSAWFDVGERHGKGLKPLAFRRCEFGFQSACKATLQSCVPA